MRRDEKYACMLAPIAVAFMILASSRANIEALLTGTRFEPILSWSLDFQEIVFSLSSGCFSGLVIWLFLVNFPYRQKRRAVKASAEMRYRLFREDVAGIFLDAAGETWELDLLERLGDPSCGFRDFREYFNEVGADGQMKRIDAVQTVLSGDKHLLGKLITELHLLAEEFQFALNTLDTDDHNLLDRCKQLIASQRSLRYSDSISTDMLDHHSKLVFRNVYGVMASWSFVKGGMDADFVAEMIEKL